MLKLERPLVAFDFETTGVDPVMDRAIQFGAFRWEPDGSQDNLETLINPERPIPIEIQEMTGITEEAVMAAPVFAKVAADIHNFLRGCDLLGFNSHNFDIVVLMEEFHRVGVEFEIGAHIDAGNIFKKMHPRTLVAAAKLYAGEDHSTAHQAGEDAMMTYWVLQGQINQHQELQGKSVEEIAAFSKMDNRIDAAGKFVLNEEGVACFNFGKDRGKPVAVNPGMLTWLLDKDFAAETKTVARRLLKTTR